MKWINDDILLILVLSLSPVLLFSIFLFGVDIGNDPLKLTLFVIVVISLVSLIIIRRKKRQKR